MSDRGPRSLDSHALNYGKPPVDPSSPSYQFTMQRKMVFLFFYFILPLSTGFIMIVLIFSLPWAQAFSVTLSWFDVWIFLGKLLFLFNSNTLVNFEFL